MAPRGEPVREPAAQTRERLQHVQRGRKCAHAPPVVPRGSRGEVPAGAAGGLHDHGTHCEDEQRERDEERSPQRAQARQPGQHRGQQEPLGHERQRGQGARLTLVERLERRSAPRAVVDVPFPAQRQREAAAVDAAAPRDVADRVVPVRELAFQQRLGPAVPALLSPVGQHRVAPVVPDQGGRAEAERPARVLEPPADVDIVARGAKARVEPVYRAQRVGPERHVAAGYVLGLVVGEQHVHRTARRGGDALRDPSVVLRRQIRSADADVRGRREAARQVLEPVRIRVRIAVEVGDDVARCVIQAGVARAAQPSVLGADEH